MTNPTTNTALSRLRTQVERHDHPNAVIDDLAVCEQSGVRLARAIVSEEAVERVAQAIHAARFDHPDHPREPTRMDASDIEYCSRLARAVLEALAADAIGDEKA